MSITGFLSKGVGLAGLCIIAYDSHNAAKDYAGMYGRHKSTENLEKMYVDTLSLQTRSVVKDKAKKSLFNFALDQNIDKTYFSISGYMKSMCASLVYNVIPLGLSAMALMTKGAVSKLSALGTVIYGALNLLGEYGHKH